MWNECQTCILLFSCLFWLPTGRVTGGLGLAKAWSADCQLGWWLRRPAWTDAEDSSLRFAASLHPQFVAQPNCQQLLATLWYDGFPGWRRRHWAVKLVTCLVIGLLFPVFSLVRLKALQKSHSQQPGENDDEKTIIIQSTYSATDTPVLPFNIINVPVETTADGLSLGWEIDEPESRGILKAMTVTPPATCGDSRLKMISADSQLASLYPRHNNSSLKNSSAQERWKDYITKIRIVCVTVFQPNKELIVQCSCIISQFSPPSPPPVFRTQKMFFIGRLESSAPFVSIFCIISRSLLSSVLIWYFYPLHSDLPAGS